MLPFIILIVVLIAGGVPIGLLWWKKRPEPERVQTACGLFIKNGHEWNGEAEAGKRVVKVAISDQEGQPNASFLLRLPALLQQLESLEAEARTYLEGLLNDEYVLEEVCSSVDAEGFTLEFVYNGEEEHPCVVLPDSDEVIGDFVSVRFKADEIVEYSTEFMH